MNLTNPIKDVIIYSNKYTVKSVLLKYSLFILCSLFAVSNSFGQACWGPVIVNTNTVPALNGTVDTVWAKAPINAITKVVNGTALQPDYAGQWRAMYDNTYLYVLVEVKDAFLYSNPSGGTTPWMYDAVEIYIDANNSKTTSYNSGDHQYAFSWGSTSVLYGSTQTGITFSIPSVAGGYNLAVKIPWSSIGTTPAAGNQIGFDININDNDNGSSSRQATSSWYSSSNQNFTNASLFGTVSLSACTSPTTGNSGAAENFQHVTDAGHSTTDTVYVGGGLGIGTTSVPSGYLLAVNGVALFTKAQIKTYATWPDYVFDDKYNLLSLTDLEEYINKNKHLPGIASADDVKKNGFEVSDNQAALLKKVEELTLYIINQDKEIKELKQQKNQLERQSNQLKQLQQKVDELEKMIKTN